MQDDLSRYARIGFAHHMLYPKCMVDPDYHVRSLEAFLKRDEFEALDCCIPYGEERRRRLIGQVRDCGKDVIYAAHLYPYDTLTLGSPSLQVQELSRLFFREQIGLAAAVGAQGITFGSGADPGESERDRALAAFEGFCGWFCRELEPHGMSALLEPFDWATAKKYLYGPSEDCVAFIRSFEPEIDNFGILLDFAHVPLMQESIEHVIKTTAPYLGRVHLGNCVMKDIDHPLYGDQHPPVGIEDGEIDVPELAEILRRLLEVGYLSTEDRKALVFEIKPFPDRTGEETAADQIERLGAAWRMI